ncbi:MAG: hypothetical protein EOP45_23765 [Sphingobacteriaceae bacterium]|nr:MAG: hypothetical protein EOP45_23765 [Sphingobacteriaceae bacterium]
METKLYECGDELAAVLLKHGFVETTGLEDKRKGKKEFRLSPKKTRMILRFDYVNLVIYEHGHGCNFKSSSIHTDDLKMLLWYIKSTTVDKNHISDGHFDLARVKQNVETMTSLLGFSIQFNHNNAESKKSERLLSKLGSIQLN